ncbi:MAG: hypothetical protein IJL63_02790 [Clostridia bacterium]|nr:hypothetical protein [Clostridia bacterium]
MKQVTRLINAVGRSVYVTDGSYRTREYSAVIQPLRYKNKMYLNGEVNDLGHYAEGYYLYIGPPDISLKRLSAAASITVSDGTRYKIERSESVYYGKDELYIWAVLKERV